MWSDLGSDQNFPQQAEPVSCDCGFLPYCVILHVPERVCRREALEL